MWYTRNTKAKPPVHIIGMKRMRAQLSMYKWPPGVHSKQPIHKIFFSSYQVSLTVLGMARHVSIVMHLTNMCVLCFETTFWLAFKTITCSQEIFSNKPPGVEEQMKVLPRLGIFPSKWNQKTGDYKFWKLLFWLHIEHETVTQNSKLCSDSTKQGW